MEMPHHPDLKCRHSSTVYRLTLTCLVIFFLLLPGGPVQSGLPAPELTGSSGDTLQVTGLLDLAWSLEVDRPDSAIALYAKAAVLAREIDYGIGEGRALQYAGIVLSDQGRFDEALRYYDTAIVKFREIGYRGGVAATLVNIGNIYQLKAVYARATDYYLQGIKLYEQMGDSVHLAYAFTNLGGIFPDVRRFDKSLSYYRRSLSISRALGDSTNLADCLINIGVNQMKQNELEAARSSLLEAAEIAVEVEDPYHFHLIYDGLSEIDTREGRDKDALANARRCLRYSEALGNPALVSLALARMGMNFTRLGRYDSAAYYLTEGIRLARENNAGEVLIAAYQWMAGLEERKQDYRSAVHWMNLHHALQDSAAGQRQKKVISGLEIAYETEKKDLELSEKSMELERNEALLAKRNYFIVALSGALVSAIFFFFLIQRSLRQKRTIAEKEAALQKEKLEQLKRKQEVLALQSMLEGQENERRRLAKDLHDGLGGLLSAVKIQLSRIGKGRKIDGSQDYRTVMGLLDTTSAEARRIAHNMMPEALVKFGLGEALGDFCNNIGESHHLSIDLQLYGLDSRWAASLEVMVYRIVQELVNNIVKHAGATEAIVQLMVNEGVLHLTLEDNGKGFDTNEVGTGGAGTGNVRSRVRLLGGTCDLESAPGRGTTWTITIPVDSMKDREMEIVSIPG